MNILDLKRRAAGHVARWNDRGTDGSGTGSGNTGGSMSGGNGHNGGSVSGGDGGFNAAKDSQAANESLGLSTNPDAFGGAVSVDGVNYGAEPSASPSDEGRVSQTPTQQAAAMGEIGAMNIARDEKSPSEEKSAEEAKETTATKAMVDSIAKEAATFNPAVDSQIANRAMGTEVRNDAKAAIAAGNPDQEGLNPQNPTQTAAQINASANVDGVIGAVAPSLASLANPGFGLAMSAMSAYQKDDLQGFLGRTTGGLLGARMGIPGMSGILGSVGGSVATGQAPNMGNIAQGFAAGTVGRAVGQSYGSVAGSLASTATNASIGVARKK